MKSEIKKVLFICPTEGVVNDDSYTHRYELNKEGEKITIKVTNYGFLVSEPEYTTIKTNVSELCEIIIRTIQKGEADINGVNTVKDIIEIIEEMNNSFVETAVYCYESEKESEMEWKKLAA